MKIPKELQMCLQVGKALGTCIRSYDTFDAAVEWAEPLRQDSIDKFEYIASITPILVSMQQESYKLCILTKEYADKGYGKSYDDIFIQHSYAGLKLSTILEEPVFGAAKVEDLLDGVGMTKGSEGYNKSRTLAANKAWGVHLPAVVKNSLKHTKNGTHKRTLPTNMGEGDPDGRHHPLIVEERCLRSHHSRRRIR